LESSTQPFRRLWFATVVSGTCVSAHDTAATWLMNSISQSTLLLSLMSTAATLPFFLFILPAGALADIAERKKVFSAAYIWLAACAGGLAILAWFHLLNAYVILGSVFLIAAGFAFNAPAFSAAVPEIVSNEELPSASTSSGLQLNISAIVGPALGGMLLLFVRAELWVAAQRAMPGWARGRMNATVIMVSQGAMALGGILWGTIAVTAGVNSSLLVQAILMLVVLIATRFRNAWSIDFTTTDDLNAVPATVMNVGYNLLTRPHLHDGPVLVTEEFELNRSGQFVELMRQVRLIYLRNGAYSWQLFEDPSRHNTFRMEMMVPSWTQYLLQQDRMTKADCDVIEQAESLHVGPNPPELRMYLGVTRSCFRTNVETQKASHQLLGKTRNQISC
jgi:Transmembrane secretion effector